MWRNLLVLAFIASLCTWSFAQPTGVPISGSTAPAMKAGVSSAGAPPAEMGYKAATKQAPTTGAAKSSQVKARVKEIGVTYVDPPYIAGYQEPASYTDPAWVGGTGYLQTVNIQTNPSGFPNGWIAQQSGSYAYGKAASRCWVKCAFTPMKSGPYEVTVTAWQQGNLKVACGYQSSVYAHRVIGVYVAGSYQTAILDKFEIGYQTGMQTREFNGPASVSKTITLYAGQTYEIWGYTEMAGWTSGNNATWQTIDVLSYVGPFKIKALF